MDEETQDTQPTIQEVILEIWKQRKERIENGLRPKHILLNKTRFQELMHYHALLGDLPEGQEDYITPDRLFDLEICLDNRVDFKIL